ncbi:MAG: phosphoribosylformimino-5-aminoimidazole carboxamide ribotide isomerase [Eubacterium sp.]|nr:phosphoribosylformimino-5-aminoimidazole carboxamide ribotide isomerase [Eubacterium sp.]
MEFRPCIDIHDGKVKQIVGGTIGDGAGIKENFVSDMSAADFARMYKEKGLKGGHIIMLDKPGSEAYKRDMEQAAGALAAWPGGMQVGGGIDPENAEELLDMGASHVIVTSYLFDDGVFRFDRLQDMKFVTGRHRLVLDLSVRRRDDKYFIVTDRWQTFTKQELKKELLEELSYSCDEFLIHAVNVEGTGMGVDEDVLRIISDARCKPVTYAGGVSSYDDIDTIKSIGQGRIHFTVGSALDIFGGSLKMEELI